MKDKSKSKKIIIALIVVVAAIVLCAILLSGNDKDKKNDNANTTAASVSSAAYIDVENPKDSQYNIGEVKSTKISLSDKEYKEFIKLADSQKLDFTYDDYYGIEEEVKKPYVKANKLEPDLQLLNDKNEIDVDKLTAIAIKNYNTRDVNAFWKQPSKEKTREICQFICKVVNDNKDKYDMNQLATMLTYLRIAQHDTSTSLAFVNPKIDFVFNPNLIKATGDVNIITGSDANEEIDTMTHEIMHLLQLASSFDGSNDEVGNIGFCRADYTDEKAITPLYYRWIIEASAETMAQNYIGFPQKNMMYSTNIKNVNNVLRMYMFDDGFSRHNIEKITLSKDLDTAYGVMGITDEKEKIDFLKVLYCYETVKEYNKTFFDVYSEKTGKDASSGSEERAAIMNNSEMDAEKYTINHFYKSFAKFVKDEKDIDLETVFFLARMSELDSSTRIGYTQKSMVDFAKEGIENHYELQQGLFKAIANSSDMSLDDINKAYDEYKMYVLDENKKEKINCNWDLFTAEQKDFITYTTNMYSYTHFARIKAMVDFYNR